MLTLGLVLVGLVMGRVLVLVVILIMGKVVVPCSLLFFMLEVFSL